MQTFCGVNINSSTAFPSPFPLGACMAWRASFWQQSSSVSLAVAVGVASQIGHELSLREEKEEEEEEEEERRSQTGLWWRRRLLTAIQGEKVR